tara:strand:- start:447 stop:686 length:240 start_codon:yes stop_codon:yes gene_type:complete
MSKSKKLNKEELESLQEYVKKLNELTLQIGNFEVQKSIIMIQVDGLQKEVNNFKKELEDKYGVVSINIEDGSISEVEEK